MTTQEIVSKLWNLCNVLRDDGITYHQYVTELTYILFLKMAKETGAETMYLEVRVSNEAAQALYRRFGFSEIGRRANYYTQPTEDAILMARSLTD